MTVATVADIKGIENIIAGGSPSVPSWVRKPKREVVMTLELATEIEGVPGGPYLLDNRVDHVECSLCGRTGVGMWGAGHRVACSTCESDARAMVKAEEKRKLEEAKQALAIVAMKIIRDQITEGGN